MRVSKNIFKDTFIYFKYMGILSARMSTPPGWDPVRLCDGCEPSRECGELNSGPLEGQRVIVNAEPSLQPKDKIIENQGLERWLSG